MTKSKKVAMSSPGDDVCVIREFPSKRNGIITESRVADIFRNAKDSLVVNEVFKDHQDDHKVSKDEETIRNLLSKRIKNKTKNKSSVMNAKKLYQRMNEYLCENEQNLAVVENSSICKMLAWNCLKVGFMLSYFLLSCLLNNVLVALA